jgi:hypothetical protein
MNKPLAFAAVAEGATGVALIVMPALVVRLLLGAELSSPALPLARVTGVALLSFGVACWPGKTATSAALAGMTSYGLLVTLYFVYLGIRGEWVGVLLWPAVVAHATLTLLLGRAWFTRHAGAAQGVR